VDFIKGQKLQKEEVTHIADTVLYAIAWGSVGSQYDTTYSADEAHDPICASMGLPPAWNVPMHVCFTVRASHPHISQIVVMYCWEVDMPQKNTSH